MLRPRILPMKKRVLIIDDEENVLNLVSATLGYDQRFDIAVARNGQEALKAAKNEVPDLVILDMLMPIMDGFQVCQALKKDPQTAHVKVIMLTAMAQEADKGKAIAAGADRYITKPFSPTKLLDIVEEILGPNC